MRVEQGDRTPVDSDLRERNAPIVVPHHHVAIEVGVVPDRLAEQAHHLNRRGRIADAGTELAVEAFGRADCFDGDHACHDGPVLQDEGEALPVGSLEEAKHLLARPERDGQRRVGPVIAKVHMPDRPDRLLRGLLGFFLAIVPRPGIYYGLIHYRTV